MDVQKYIDQIIELAVAYAPKVLMAILTLIIGLWVIGIILKGVRKALEKRKMDPSLAPFLVSIFGALLKVALVISIASIVGIETTSFVAILGAMGLAVGLALQGSLGNFAGGVLILILRPFKVGDFITTQGNSGTVREIQIFHTILKTPDNRTIIIPNGPIANGDIVNFSTEAKRRVDFSFGIGYSDDIDKAQAVLMKLISEDSRIDKEPAPFVRVGELADSSVNFTVRVWANASDYWGIHFDLIEKVKKAFDQEGISIPFPQRDVHIYNEK